LPGVFVKIPNVWIGGARDLPNPASHHPTILGNATAQLPGIPTKKSKAGSIATWIFARFQWKFG
jgi:hypothetical protein